MNSPSFKQIIASLIYLVVSYIIFEIIFRVYAWLMNSVILEIFDWFNNQSFLIKIILLLIGVSAIFMLIIQITVVLANAFSTLVNSLFRINIFMQVCSTIFALYNIYTSTIITHQSIINWNFWTVIEFILIFAFIVSLNTSLIPKRKNKSIDLKNSKESKETEILQNNHDDLDRVSNSGSFVLCSQHSISLAIKNIKSLSDNNEVDKRYYKSYLSLNCSKEELIKSFYFLKDCVIFCEHDKKLYNNEKLKSRMGFLQTMMTQTYLDVESNVIPTETRENMSFGRTYNLRDNLNEKQLNELRLIDWRNNAEWEYWCNIYGEDTALGEYCFNQIK